MKRPAFLILYALALIAAAVIAAKAQPAGYTEVPQLPGHGSAIFNFNSNADGCWIRDNGIYDAEKLRPFRAVPKCLESINALNLDPTKHTLIGWAAHSDCHMHVKAKVFRSEAEKKYLAIINNIYGGCRAGGSRSGWIVIDKMPDDYAFDMKEVRVDRIHGVNATGEDFYFPKPKSDIKPVLLDSREIDAGGCLPLDRQSQWILIKEEFLKTALENKSRECRQHFKKLAIDFEKYTLAGYNVNTGDCYRPPDLEHRVFNDAGEKRYVMEISYIRNHGSCHVPRWHAVWVLVPKLPGDYGFEFKLDPKERPDETKPQARSH